MVPRSAHSASSLSICDRIVSVSLNDICPVYLCSRYTCVHVRRSRALCIRSRQAPKSPRYAPTPEPEKHAEHFPRNFSLSPFVPPSFPPCLLVRASKKRTPAIETKSRAWRGRRALREMNAAVYSLDNKTGVIARRGIPFKCEFFAKRNLHVSVCRRMSYISVAVSLFSDNEIRRRI